MRKVNKTFEVNFSSDVLTRECAGQVFIAIYELLLFQRNVIPFVYPTFKYLVNRLPDLDEDHEDDVLLHTQRQVADVKLVLENIKDHFEVRF